MALDIKLAAMSLIWNNPNGEKFISWLEEVKEAGYDGITGFAHIGWEDYLQAPTQFKQMLNHAGLQLASMDVTHHEDLDYFKRACEFLAHNECRNMAYIDPKGGPKEDYARLAERLNKIGEISLQYGVRTLYHNHTRGIGETFGELERLHASVDPDKVFMMLDLGHATLDFTDVPLQERAVRFLTKYWDRIAFMEFKDWNEITNLNTPLGEGHCNYEAVFQLIKDKGFSGWITVEQNGNEGLSLSRTPLQCATISREFIRKGLGI